MKLQEIANTKVKSKLLRQSESAFGREAEIGGRMIRFTAIRDEWADGPVWDIVFSEIEYGEQGEVDRDYGKTGSGKEFEVAAFVIDSMKEFLTSYSPKQVYFTADKEDEHDNRSRLYQKMATRLMKDYDRVRPEHGAELEGKEVFFYRRKQ